MTKITGGTPWTERMLGFVGLFLIGPIGAWADRFGRSLQPEKPCSPTVRGGRGRDGYDWAGLGPSGTMASDALLTFDRFKIDPSSGQLVGESGPISLTPKALSLLEYLAARPGRLVMKTELLDAIWPGVFVADGALKVCIREIRRALGDDAQAPRFIETAHRRGYRFIPDVNQSMSADHAPRSVPVLDRIGVMPGPVQYARSGDVNIAYQICGEGAVDLVFVMGWVSHLEYFWKEPSFARFLGRLASFSRL